MGTNAIATVVLSGSNLNVMPSNSALTVVLSNSDLNESSDTMS